MMISSKDKESSKIKDTTDLIVKTMVGLNDRDVTALTYVLFPELTKDSLIKKQIEKRISNRNIKGINITELDKENLKKFLSESKKKIEKV
jgi:hypothetical protein